MHNLGKIIAIILFITVAVIYLFILDYYSYLTLGINQIHNIISYEPNFKYYISSNNLTLCIINNQNFSITVYNISGKSIYLPKIQVIPSLTEKNISLIITNQKQFDQNLNNSNCPLNITIGFLDSNISFTQVI
ncbi:hypothetical protein DFR86_01570 [Acidianus sulfidivorans JP7]|nr:hypothetical protein [Acidianus sulfidivorans]AWR96364.2 hypothetical protein DFR86_01570 [Acidianus sulfidivorans JP7]